MPIFKQTSFRPGRYRIGMSDGKPVFRDYKREDVARIAEGTKALLAAKRHVPLLLEHAEPGSAEGSPRDKKASEVKHGAGWLKDVAIGNDGAMQLVFDVPDADIAGKLKSGSIKFTSPEIRSEWVDGKGQKFNDFISHVALTHKPRNPDQSAIEEVAATETAVQFSLDDYEGPIQMSDEYEGDEKPEEMPEAKPDGNPDMVQNGSEESQQFDAIRSLLREIVGVDLPADATAESLVRDLLTGLKTLKAVRDQKKAEEEANKPNPDTSPEVVENSPVQFSVDDVPTISNKLLAKAITSEHAATKARFDALVTAGKCSPGLRDALLTSECVQFSDEAELVKTMSVAQVLDLLEAHPLDLAAQFSDDFFRQIEPSKDFTAGPADGMTDDQARAFVDTHFPTLKRGS